MAVGSHSLPFAWLPNEPLHFCEHGAGPAGVWEDPNVHLHPVSSLGQNPKHTGVGLCQLPALSRSRPSMPWPILRASQASRPQNYKWSLRCQNPKAKAFPNWREPSGRLWDAQFGQKQP